MEKAHKTSTDYFFHSSHLPLSGSFSFLLIPPANPPFHPPAPILSLSFLFCTFFLLPWRLKSVLIHIYVYIYFLVFFLDIFK